MTARSLPNNKSGQQGVQLLPDGRKRRSKPTKYNAKVHKQIVEQVGKGTSIGDAGLMAGLGKDTLHSWLYYGRHDPEMYPQFAKLAEDIEEARANLRGELVAQIKTTALSGAPGTWQAAAWYLERTDPENWGRRDQVKVENTGAPRVQLNQVILIDSDARQEARELLRAVASDVRPDIPVGPSGRLQLEAGGDS